VRGASTENFGTRVAYVGVAHGLLNSAIVIVELAAKQSQPLAEIQNIVEVEIRGPGLNQEHLALRKVAGEAGSDDTASSAAPDDDVIVRGL
jgi:hypothetical protein